MKLEYSKAVRLATLLILAVSVILTSSQLRADTGTCGGSSITPPFTDVVNSNIFFCAIAEAYSSGLTNGTSPTTYSPSQNVSRDQMAAFITRTLDQSLRRGSRRAALNQWYTPKSNFLQKRTQVGDQPFGVACDGADVWVTNLASHSISRVRASDGKLLETWTGPAAMRGVCVAGGRVYAVGGSSPGQLYMLDPSQPVGPVTVSIGELVDAPNRVTSDGFSIWATGGNGVSKASPDGIVAQTFTAGFSIPLGILYDGSNIWVCDKGDNMLKKLNANGAVIQEVPVGLSPIDPVFDGVNIWVPNNSSGSVTVVRAETGQVIATLTGNGLTDPRSAAFDGDRILVTNLNGNSVSLWRATNLAPLGSYSFLPNSMPNAVCSDGANFWVLLQTADALARF